MLSLFYLAPAVIIVKAVPTAVSSCSKGGLELLQLHVAELHAQGASLMLALPLPSLACILASIQPQSVRVCSCSADDDDVSVVQGLDSTTAMHLLQLLRQLSQGGRAIVTTIHQPSSRLYQQLDKLLLLSQVCTRTDLNVLCP